MKRHESAARRHETYVHQHRAATAGLSELDRLAYYAAAHEMVLESTGWMIHEALVAGTGRVAVREVLATTLEEMRQEWLGYIEECTIRGGLPPAEDIGEVAAALWCEREVLAILEEAEREVPDRVRRWAAERRAFVTAWDDRHADSLAELQDEGGPAVA